MAYPSKVAYILYPNKVKNIDHMERLLNEVVCTMDKSWQIHIISNFSWSFRKINCDYQVYVVPTILSEGFLPLVFYFVSVFLKGIKVVRKHRIPVIGCIDGHVYLGFLAYLVSRVAQNKCIIRVNEDTILDLTISLKRRWKNPILSRRFSLYAVTSILRVVEYYLFKHADWIITQGPMDYARIKKINGRVTLIPLWVDAKNFTSMKPESTKKRHEKDRVLLFVGRLAFIKGLEYLFRAFKIVLQNTPNITLVIVGSGQDEEEYKRIATDLGIWEKTRFVGWVPHDELPKYYQSADVYVLPSLREEFSNTIIEAMVCKVPVIATNVGGNPYLIKEGRTGFLVAPRDPVALANRIILLLNNPDLANEIRSNAFRLVGEYDNRENVGEMHKKAILNVTRLSNGVME